MNDHDSLVFENQVSSIVDAVESSVRKNCLIEDYTHYESRAFSVQMAINPLVSAAAPLLHLATQLRSQFQPPDLEHLFQALCYEVRTLEYRAHACDYPPQVVLGARYLLCALIDEIISSSSWGRKRWNQQNLLNTFQHEVWGGERFFTILQRCSQNPAHYIDLLELGYLCLSLGFKGKYNQPESSQALDHLIDNLYKLIRRQRGDFPRLLTVDSHEPEVRPKFYLRSPPLWVAIFFMIIILSAIFIPYYRHLQQLAEPGYQNLINSEILLAPQSGSNG